MSNIPSLTPEDLIKILARKGFVFDRSSGSHRIYLHPEQKKRVVVAYHTKDIPKGTLYSILKDAGISKDEFF